MLAATPCYAPGERVRDLQPLRSHAAAKQQDDSMPDPLILETLVAFPPCSDMPMLLMERLAEIGRRISYRPRDRIVSADEAVRGLHVVRSGCGSLLIALVTNADVAAPRSGGIAVAGSTALHAPVSVERTMSAADGGASVTLTKSGAPTTRAARSGSSLASVADVNAAHAKASLVKSKLVS